MLNVTLALVGAPDITGTSASLAQSDVRTCCKGLTHPPNMDLMTPPAGVSFAENWAAAEEAI